MKILLTGFDGFGGLSANPSRVVTQQMAERANRDGRQDLLTEILPVEFSASGERIRELIRENHPSAVVLTGVSAGLGAIGFERVALNLDDTGEPDNAGDKPEGRIIVPAGPAAYWSTLPIGRFRKALNALNIPASVSNHAGTFVCNHAFYEARHEVEQSGTGAMCGFIHLPLMSEQAEASAFGSPGMPLTVMLEALECCLDVLRNSFQAFQE